MNKGDRFWNVEYVKGTTATSDAVLIYQLAQYSVKIFPIHSNAKRHRKNRFFSNRYVASFNIRRFVCLKIYNCKLR